MLLIKNNNPTPLQKERIFQLWNTAYPSAITYVFMAQLNSYLNNLLDPEHYFLINDENEIAAWALTFSRDNEKWFAIIISEDYQEKGLGTFLLNQIKWNETILNGWVIDSNKYFKSDGTPYVSPLSFYIKNNFKVLRDIRLEIPQMSAVKIRWHKP
jgi:hypothetical protein